MRRYDLSRSEAIRILTRMAREGWVERLPGKGWGFLPVLTSSEAYRMAYQFRIAIEPAAILQPGYTVDEEGFRRARAQQQALLDGDYRTLSRTKLFEINSQFHEMIVAGSGNLYFIESIKRVNASRRLAEYRKTVDRSRLVGQSLEHLRILELLEAGDVAKAAEFIRFHLEYALKLKADGTLGLARGPLRGRSAPFRAKSRLTYVAVLCNPSMVVVARTQGAAASIAAMPTEP